ncbi:sigma-70 family RNA polymerase sigma factor [Myroides odoratimimus]|uniref:RNA polymerase sigma factor n=1 Tax=Myroides odoratimimus TaxID=76832 RepID=UPI001039AD1F|nr:sigma-70 family RNA polymerase sigma factor [Myroides odoratimimus]MDM1411873.1 sigma-70 family RNA polymerase sigma factor [Myroides odoratimimus]MDM1530531.1 sigma-70 family RNA polymerase sigma factor [Myroides odoratimimus]MDM1537335.1 sigma-70 family RNA polymerase sigma factor [Myroides odoratimimus]MDM1676887.1 sigma-70 family RNA polymerase sigma factor [Myroides odoratimimus]MDO5858655.1 sigma-70 family RNA polymerase sigma factor [Myroides odoratimimus]
MTNKDRFVNNLYTSYWESLYIYANNLTQNTAQTEDIIQEVFIDLWKRFDTLHIENFKAYLYTAVKYKCLEYLRNRKFTSVELETAYEALSEFELLTVEEQEQFKLYLLEQVKSKAEEILPEKCLEIFQLRYYSQKSYSEIAQLLNLSENTVKNQLNKALSLLRANLSYSVEAFFFFLLFVK